MNYVEKVKSELAQWASDKRTSAIFGPALLPDEETLISALAAMLEDAHQLGRVEGLKWARATTHDKLTDQIDRLENGVE